MAPLEATDVRPDPGLQAAVLDGLVSGMPATAARATQRARLLALSQFIEQKSRRPHNLAEITYLLIGVSLQATTGTLLDGTRSTEFIRRINDAYMGDERYTALDGVRRTKLYYLYVATLAMTTSLSQSAQPAEVEAGKSLAKLTLRELGVPVDSVR